jgi:hypothetical protein
MSNLNKCIMRRLIILLMTMALFSVSCNKDDPITTIDDFNMSINDGKPIAVSLNMFADKSDTEPFSFNTKECGEVCIPRTGWLGGSFTDTKTINLKRSDFVIYNCTYNSEEGRITESISGIIKMENGDDAFFFSGVLTIELEEAIITGVININKGYGKFTDATGKLTLGGIENIVTGCCSVNGKGVIYN